MGINQILYSRSTRIHGGSIFLDFFAPPYTRINILNELWTCISSLMIIHVYPQKYVPMNLKKKLTIQSLPIWIWMIPQYVQWPTPMTYLYLFHAFVIMLYTSMTDALYKCSFINKKLGIFFLSVENLVRNIWRKPIWSRFLCGDLFYIHVVGHCVRDAGCPVRQGVRTLCLWIWYTWGQLTFT